MHKPTQDSCRGIQRHGHVSSRSVKHVGNRHADTGDETADVPTQHACYLRAFESKVDGLILMMAQNTYFGTGAEQDRENESEAHTIGNAALVPDEDLLYEAEAHHDARDGSRYGDLDEQCGDLRLVEHQRSYNKGVESGAGQLCR